MKKSLLSLAVIAVSLSACDTTPKYNINGTITGGEANNVYLLQRQGRTIDTLAKAPVAEGKFKLTGSVAGLTPAFIVVEGQRGGDLIFVENADFTANLNLENPTASKIEGTATQGIANQYTAISNEMGKMAKELNQSYRTAYQEKDEAKMKELQEQYENLMKDYEADPDSVWKSEMFGRSLDNIVQEGIRGKLSLMPDNIRHKLQTTLTKVVNKGSNNMIAIVI